MTTSLKVAVFLLVSANAVHAQTLQDLNPEMVAQMRELAYEAQVEWVAENCNNNLSPEVIAAAILALDTAENRQAVLYLRNMYSEGTAIMKARGEDPCSLALK